jgi:Tol biopolymer transport system component
MNPERFARVKEILLRALDLPETERGVLLDRECAGDPELRREVEELLARERNNPSLRKSESTGSGDTGSFQPDEPAAHLAGRAISHYRIGEILGQGGMGVVYRAVDTVLNRPVALKFLPREFIGIGESRARFIREARAAAALDHPNICTVHAIEEAEGTLFLAMALIEGETLRERIRQGPLPPEEALGIAAQVAQGLQAAHSKGIIHRDIKPTNIMISHDGRAQILDFGLARSGEPSDVTRSGIILGTVAYMSPEQAQGGPLDARTDLWSLGVVLFEMLTGRRPFAGETDGGVLHAITHEDPPDVHDLRPELPKGFSGILSHALARSRDERYADAEEFRHDLERLRAEPWTSISRIRHASLLRRRIRRSYRLAGAGLLVAAAALVTGLILRAQHAATPMPRVQSHQVTFGAGPDEEPAISPDGSRIAYVSHETGRSTINLIDVRGGNPIVLTPDSSLNRSPSWFPDGSRLVYISNRSGIDAVWQIGQYGGGATMLIPHAYDPAVSPDGKRIAFSRLTPAGHLRISVATISSPADSTVLTHDDEGLWHHTNPAWSPNGRTICYQSSAELWLVPSRGGAARRLTEGGADCEPAWSPSGRMVYFSSWRGGQTRALWRVSTRGGSPERVTLGVGGEVNPTLSRDGFRLAYATERSRIAQVIRDQRTGVEQRLSKVNEAIMPAIAPDGTRFAFVSHRLGENSDLWLQPLREGRPEGAPQLLSSQNGNTSHPVFSPDGRWIAYYCILRGQRDIWIVSATGGQPNRITDNPAADIQPAWSPDGRSLVFSSDRGGSEQLWIVPVLEGRAAGPEKPLPTPGVLAFKPDWSPDGREIAFIGGKAGEMDGWTVSVEGGGPPGRVTSGLALARLRWQKDGRGFLASIGQGRVFLYTLSLDGRNREEVEPRVDFGAEMAWAYFDLSADGRWLVYTKDEGAQGNIWVLESGPESL